MNARSSCRLAKYYIEYYSHTDILAAEGHSIQAAVWIARDSLENARQALTTAQQLFESHIDSSRLPLSYAEHCTRRSLLHRLERKVF